MDIYCASVCVDWNASCPGHDHVEVHALNTYAGLLSATLQVQVPTNAHNPNNLMTQDAIYSKRPTFQTRYVATASFKACYDV